MFRRTNGNPCSHFFIVCVCVKCMCSTVLVAITSIDSNRMFPKPIQISKYSKPKEVFLTDGNETSFESMKETCYANLCCSCNISIFEHVHKYRLGSHMQRECVRVQCRVLPARVEQEHQLRRSREPIRLHHLRRLVRLINMFSLSESIFLFGIYYFAFH